MKNVFRRFVRDESGATAIEYGLIASLQTLQGNLKDTFNSVGTAVKDAK